MIQIVSDELAWSTIDNIYLRSRPLQTHSHDLFIFILSTLQNNTIRFKIVNVFCVQPYNVVD